MLIKMRTAVAKVFVFGLFGLLIMSFAVWGIGDIFYGTGQSTAVAEVGDVAIDQREFSRDLNREMARVQQRLGTRLTLEQASAFGVVNQVLAGLVTGALYDQQALDMGLVVSDDQIKQQLLAEPSFQDSTGNFDPNRFTQALRNIGMSESQYLATLRRDIRRQQVTAALSGSATAPQALAETVHAYRGEQRSAEIVRLPLDRVAVPGDPDEETLKAFYETEQSSFMRPETRSVTYLQVGQEDVIGEIEITDDAAREAFEQRPDDFVTAERREISQLVFSDQDAAQAAHGGLATGQSFEEIGTDSQSGAPVALGRLSRSELEALLPELADPAFALDAGGTSTPVSSPFGWHLVHVGEIEAGDEPNFEAVRDKVVETLKTEQAVDAMVSMVNEVDDQLAGGAVLEEVAESLALTLHQVAALDVGGNDGEGNRVEDLPQPTLFLRTAFETEVGEDSILLETEDGGYFILRVDGTSPSAVRPFEEVRNQAIGLWKTEERLRQLEEQADTLAERAKGGETLAQIAEAEGLTAEPLGPFERSGSDPAAGASREVSRPCSPWPRAMWRPRAAGTASSCCG